MKNSQSIKHEWKKSEKQLYLPKARPELVRVPAFRFFSISGQGNPNEKPFQENISVLYSLSYAVKMSQRNNFAPEDYFEYTVYPLEGVWDLTEEGRKSGHLDKDQLVFNLMIRQPDFITPDFALEAIDRTRKKKYHPLLDKVRFETIEEGNCIQMMHIGSYDSEPESFSQMEDFCRQIGHTRDSKRHREIYISDFRKVPAEKLRTVLRFKIQ